VTQRVDTHPVSGQEVELAIRTNTATKAVKQDDGVGTTGNRAATLLRNRIIVPNIKNLNFG